MGENSISSSDHINWPKNLKLFLFDEELYKIFKKIIWST